MSKPAYCAVESSYVRTKVEQSRVEHTSKVEASVFEQTCDGNDGRQ